MSDRHPFEDLVLHEEDKALLYVDGVRPGTTAALGPSCRRPHPDLAGHSCALERGHEPGCAYAPDELMPDEETQLPGGRP